MILIPNTNPLVIFQTKMPNITKFQLINCEDFLLSVIVN